MKTTELKAFKRTDLGKKSTKELRKKGMVPSVLYGGKENVHFYVNRVDFEKLLYTPDIFLISLDIEGKSYNAVIQDLQFHPVSDIVLHADLLQVFDDKPISIGVPVKTTGLSRGVKAGGKLTIQQRKLLVKGLVKDIPNELVIDVTKLGLGKSIQVGELNYPNLELLNAKQSVVVAVKTSRMATEDSDEDEEHETHSEDSTEEAAEN